MPVLLPPIPDPFDVVLQGELLRSLDVTKEVDMVAVQAPIFVTSSHAIQAVPMVQMDGVNMLSMAGQNWSQLGAQANRPIAREVPISTNGVVCTPCGAVIPFECVGSMISRFVQASLRWRVAGNTRDLGGTILPECRVVVLEVGRIQTDGAPCVGETISDGGGVYAVDVPMNVHYQVIAYKPGSPDVAGITRADVVADPI